MGRLTERGKGGNPYYPHCFRTKECKGKGASVRCSSCAFNDKICEKLASYEEIIDEPEKLKQIDEWYSELCKENGQLKKELAEYKRLEDAGLLLRLPCKEGTPVYMVAQDCGGDTLDCRRGDCESCNYLYCFVEENKFDTYMRDEIGKTIFLTREEAEQALKRMEEQNGEN